MDRDEKKPARICGECGRPLGRISTPCARLKLEGNENHMVCQECHSKCEYRPNAYRLTFFCVHCEYELKHHDEISELMRLKKERPDIKVNKNNLNAMRAAHYTEKIKQMLEEKKK